ncbi:hypothetical protein ASZ90_019071 [hydrocarbon metagenome]|uniref:DUF4875 domain-containing protein n=1 Tax=hydrocarbon metagenome TaxID=938273 RepID=A0A0W8E4L4_9ZZZZ
MEEKQAVKPELRVFVIYVLILLAIGSLLLVMLLNQKPVNISIPYTIELVEDSSTPDAIQYTWHVVVQEPVRILDLRYTAERLIEEAQAGSSFNALEIMIYDYPEYIGYGYTLARVVFAPEGDLRKANTIKPGDYDQMSIQWDLREKIWEKQLSQDEVVIWKAWQDYYSEQAVKEAMPDKNLISEVIADTYNMEPSDIDAIRLKQEYWRYANFDYITR